MTEPFLATDVSGQRLESELTITGAIRVLTSGEFYFTDAKSVDFAIFLIENCPDITQDQLHELNSLLRAKILEK